MELLKAMGYGKTPAVAPKKRGGWKRRHTGGRVHDDSRYLDVVACIREHGPATCAEIAKVLGLTRMQVTDAIRRGKHGMLRHVDYKPGRGSAPIWGLK